MDWVDGDLESGQSSRQQTTQQLAAAGRKEMKGVESALGRAERVVEDTIQIGTQARHHDRKRPPQTGRFCA